jgi:muconolactone delta-isomerase
MKFLAIEQDVPGIRDDQCTPHLRAEAERAWELHQSGVLREIYFRADKDAAVLMLECLDRAEAEGILATLPLVREGLIRFDVIPLVPYPGFKRLFASGCR